MRPVDASLPIGAMDAVVAARQERERRDKEEELQLQGTMGS